MSQFPKKKKNEPLEPVKKGVYIVENWVSTNPGNRIVPGFVDKRKIFG